MSSLTTATTSSLSSLPLKTLYARLMLVRLVDEQLQALCKQGYIDDYASCQGHEAAQVGSAACIEVGQDFTLPYYRDLGVVLTIGMTTYEAIRTCLSTYTSLEQMHETHSQQKQPLQWSYHKHNMVHGNASAATHVLHAAGIAFAAKLRRTSAVTVAYCGDGATSDPDFLEGIRFAAQHQLPVIFICEQECTTTHTLETSSCFRGLPSGLLHKRIDGMDIVQVYETMQATMDQVRKGSGPVLLEAAVARNSLLVSDEPLKHCEQILREHGLWDDDWAKHLQTRLHNEVEQATYEALLDVKSSRH